MRTCKYSLRPATALVKKLHCLLLFCQFLFNPLYARNGYKLMQTGWIQASRRYARRLA